jgi:hypothetical protein
MKLSQATILILALFGSFGVVLAAMIFFLRPVSETVRKPSDPLVSPQIVEEVVVATEISANDTSSHTGSSEISNQMPKATPVSQPPPVSTESIRFQKKLQQEKKEMGSLRLEMERRLKSQIAARKKKITLLARNCQKLGPGEAAGILLELDNETIADVLGHMDKNAAIKISAILGQLGRKTIKTN